MIDVDVYAGRVRVVFDAHRERCLTINGRPRARICTTWGQQECHGSIPSQTSVVSPTDRLASCACTRGIRRTAPHTAQALPTFA